MWEKTMREEQLDWSESKVFLVTISFTSVMKRFLTGAAGPGAAGSQYGR